MTVSIKSPTSTTGSIQLNGSDVLTIDNSGNLTAPNNLTVTGSITGDGSNLTGVSAGKVLQAVQVFDRQQSSYTCLDIDNAYSNYGLNEAGIDLTTLDATITPSSTSSKILILSNISLGLADQTYGVLRIKRGIGGATPSYSASDNYMSANNAVTGTLSPAGAQSITNRSTSWEQRQLNFSWLDSPNTTSAVTYRFNMRLEADLSTTLYINRAFYNTNDYGSSSGTSSVILLEVAG